MQASSYCLCTRISPFMTTSKFEFKLLNKRYLGIYYLASKRLWSVYLCDFPLSTVGFSFWKHQFCRTVGQNSCIEKEKGFSLMKPMLKMWLEDPKILAQITLITFVPVVKTQLLLWLNNLVTVKVIFKWTLSTHKPWS